MSISMGSDTGGEYDVYWFSYNDEGLRVRKSVNGYADITYLYNGSQLIGEKVNNDVLLLYIYDEAGSVIGLKYREAIYSGDLYDCYYFEKNLQGDIVAIYNEAGTKIGGYKYDAWGKPAVVLESTATTIERQIVQTYNPFRYRGYYYDTETDLYYLQSRYYNPEWGRFLNADDPGYLGANGDLISYNLFTYCGNNPITRVDSAGDFWNTIIGAVTGAIVGGITAAITGSDIGAGIVSGAISGAITGAAVDIVIATGGTGLVAFAAVTAAGGFGGAVSSYVNQRMNGTKHENIDVGTIVVDTIWGAVGGVLSYGAADIGSTACKTLSDIFSQSGKEIGKQMMSDMSVTAVIGAGTWLNGAKMNAVRNIRNHS